MWSRGLETTSRTGNSYDILYISVFEKMGFRMSKLEPFPGLIVGFTGHVASTLGMITLPIIVGEGSRTATQMMQFTVVQMDSAYNDIIERPFILNFQAILFSYQLMIKFTTPE